MTAGEGPVDASLGRMAGGSEWTIELFCDEVRLAATLPETAIQIHHAASASLWYRLAKQLQARAARQVERRMTELPDEILDAIEPHVLEVVERPVLPGARDARRARVSRLTALVPRGSEGAFRAALLSLGERLAREGATLEVQGPPALPRFAGPRPAPAQTAGEGIKPRRGPVDVGERGGTTRRMRHGREIAMTEESFAPTATRGGMPARARVPGC